MTGRNAAEVEGVVERAEEGKSVPGEALGKEVRIEAEEVREAAQLAAAAVKCHVLSSCYKGRSCCYAKVQEEE